MIKTLFLGYGNFDRQDDGVAWHVLCALAEHFEKPLPASPDDGVEPEGDFPHFLYQLQLTPELAEVIAQYDRVVFVDAHTGSVPDEVNLAPVASVFQSSPLTHHLTPQSCMEMVKALYQSHPVALLASIRGYEFKFSQSLSSRTANLVPQAVQRILDWLADYETD